jgi:hypothetical protein
MKFYNPTADLLYDLSTDAPPAIAASCLEIGIAKVHSLKREIASATRVATRWNLSADVLAIQACVDVIFERMMTDYPHWLQCPVNQEPKC